MQPINGEDVFAALELGFKHPTTVVFYHDISGIPIVLDYYSVIGKSITEITQWLDDLFYEKKVRVCYYNSADYGQVAVLQELLPKCRFVTRNKHGRVF